MNLEKIKKAHQLLGELSGLTLDEATEKLNTYTEIDPKVKQLTLDLLKNAQQSSHYFNDKIGSLFNMEGEHRNQLAIGSQIGDYTVTALLGEGGMSQVYSAIRKDTDVQKPIAIKVFSPINHSSELKQRFIAEQYILSGLSHPHIIAMQHGGITENGQPYFVMELVKGASTIVVYAHQKNLNTTEKINLILTAAQAIEYAHNNLIIHRDLKPNNIIISEDGELKLVDFGIAKLIPTNQEADHHTMMALTPEYAAPEQIKSQNITVKADVFSLAAVAVNLLSDVKPFPDNRLLKACADDELHLQAVLKAHIKDKDLLNVLNKALQQDPKRRYQNMHEFSRDLKFWLNKKPVTASPNSYYYRLSKFCQRRPAFSASLMVLVVTFTLGLLLFSWQYKQTQLEAQKATAVKQFMLDAFNETDPNFTEGIDVSAQDILKKAADKLADNTAMDRDVQFELFQSLGLAYGQLGEYIKGTALLKKSLEIDPNNSRSLAQLAQFLLNSQQEKELVDLLNQIDESNFPDSDQARVLRIRSSNAVLKGDHESAFKWFNKLDQIEFDHLGELTNQRLEAELYYVMGQSLKSIEIIKAAIHSANLKPTNTFMLSMQSDLIHYYDRVDDIDSALELALEVADTHRKVLGNKHNGLGLILNELAVFYRLKGDLEQSKIIAEEAKDLFQSLYGNYSAGLSQAISNLGMLDHLAGNGVAAIEKYTQVTDILRQVYSSDHPETLVAEANLATIMTAHGQSKGAKPLLMHVYQVESETLGRHHRSTLYTQQSLALNLANNGEFDLASEQAKDNYELTREFFDHNLPLVINSQKIYGQVLLMAGHYQQALDLLLPLENQFVENNAFDSFRLSRDLAPIYAALNEPQKADEYYKKALIGMADVYAPEHIKTMEVRLEYAQFLKAQQRTEEANKIVRDIAVLIEDNNVSAPELSAQLAEL